ncbi:DUF4259 domain-containing protein [Sinanaerobacter chloroacetimidivorans]|uniref:DUF4259 domain-containing protein n=1 Tax=Sinanaerobacter chloroacetimidivorans TaxID=2818044 RepID=A0A8J8B0A6_9FIRM|nr:DUF4259 domain-containing protein [Sinanaerobacter chloroacetimidivorans]MBR0596411.1 DUF4259 domain-containing protein [Sinanaerobacter chloroacetimidivorans]
MGCWGITAFESDAGLDAKGFIRENLPEDGKLELEKILEGLQHDAWNAPPDVMNAESHTSPMALAEIIVKFLDREVDSLDNAGAWAEKEKKFGAVTSFTATREVVRWLRDYLCDTLNYAMKGAEERRKWGGWFQKKDWHAWQNHMAVLIGRLDGVLSAEGQSLVLFSKAEPNEKQETDMGMTMQQSI